MDETTKKVSIESLSAIQIIKYALSSSGKMAMEMFWKYWLHAWGGWRTVVWKYEWCSKIDVISTGWEKYWKSQSNKPGRRRTQKSWKTWDH